MTTVHISLGRDDGTDQTAAKGVVEWEPTTRREDGTMVILERGFTVPLVAGEASVTVDPSGLTWCWRVTERTDSGGVVRYVSVPDSAVTVEYVDLPDVDPDTLLPWSPADPEAAYQTALDNLDVEQAVETYLLANPVSAPVSSVDGKTGAVSLSSTYVAQFVVDDTPAAPAEGTSATYFVTSAVSWPAGLEWSTDPDGGVAPTITGTALVSLFTYGGVTRAILGATFPALPAAPDTTAPTAGTLSVVMGSTTADLTVAGATDETALAALPYAYSLNGGAYTDYQAAATYQFDSLTPETSFTFRHKVKDAAGNETEGTAVTDSTTAVPADSTPPTAGTLAPSSITDTSFTLTVTGAADETALAAEPYSFDDGSGVFGAYQSSPSLAVTGKIAETAYPCQHRVKDAAGNVSTGTAITVTTSAAAPATFFTDFSEYTAGVAPSDWTFSGDIFTITAGAGVDSSNALQLSSASNITQPASWDDAGTPADVEVVARFKNTSIVYSTVLIARYVSGPSLYFVNATSAPTLNKKVNGASSVVIATGGTAASADTWHWARLRAEGATISYKLWVDGSAEPGTWSGTVTDTSVTAGGRVGVGTYSASDTLTVDRVGIALDGGTAPVVAP